MAGPFVTIIVPPYAPGMEPQTINVDINGPDIVYIIGGGKFAIGFQDPEDAASFGGQKGDQNSDALKNALGDAAQRIKDLGVGGDGTTTPQVHPAQPPTPASTEAMSTMFPSIPASEEKVMRDMGFDDNAIREYIDKKQPTPPAEGLQGNENTAPKEPMPGVPVVDLKDMEDTEARVGYLETLEDTAALANQKLALGLFRNAKDEARQDLVDRICTWMGLPEMMVETMAPKAG